VAPRRRVGRRERDGEAARRSITALTAPATGTWTAVTGVMTGTFTKPMATPDGKSIAPTGKRFAIGMATIGHWGGSSMDHAWLFWDSKDFMQQIGLGQ